MSIQAVAGHLGISVSTVSRALNGYSDVSLKTRERVFAAAKALNYSPHPVAHRLATGRTGVIAMINSSRANGVADDETAQVYSSVAQVLKEQQYFLVSLSIPVGSEEISELERLLAGRLFDAIILTRMRRFDPCVKLLQERNFPFITYGRTLDNAPHAWVDSDNEGVFEHATQALIAHGHRSIAFINGLPHQTFASLRDSGFRKAIAQAGLSDKDCPVHYTELTSEAGRHVTEHLLNAPQRPSAILCATDNTALGAMQAIRAAGLQVGKDISLMGYGDTEIAQFTDPPLSSIKTTMQMHGVALGKLLLEVLAGKPIDGLQELFSPELRLRASVSVFAPSATLMVAANPPPLA